MKKQNFIRTFFAAVGLLFIAGGLQAQLVNCNVFLKGNYVEVGINSNGAFGSGEAAPGGYHPRGGVSMKNSCTGTCTGTLGLGWVADPDRDGWTTGTPAYFGDYFLPGSPQEGWSLEVNGVQSNAWNQNAGCGSGVYFTGTLSGTNISYTNSGSRSTGTWQGIDGNGIAVTQITTLDTNNLFFTISVTLKNTTGTVKNNVYYMRTVDPDQEVAITGVYTTINTVAYQLPDSLNATLVSATGVTYTRAYLGLGTLDCRAKCFLINSGLAPTVNCDALYAGSATVRYSGSDTLDAGLGIVFNLGNITAGDSVKFAYAYILNTSDIINAFKSTLPNWTATGDTSSAHVVGDTASVCVGTLTTVSITNPGTFTWSWTALTGETLTSYTGPSTQVTTGATIIALMAVGIDACTGMRDTLYTNLNPIKPLPATPTAGSSSPVCEGSTLNLTSTCTTPGVAYSWAGPGSFSSGLQNPSITNMPLTGAGVYTVTALLSGCPSSLGATTTVTVNPLPSPITGTASVCVGSTTTLSDISGGAVWSSTSTAVATIGSASGIVTGVSAGNSTISYTLLSTGCAATKIVTVNPLPAAITGVFTVCPGATTTLNDVTAGGAWTVTNAHATVAGGVVTGVTAGLDTVKYTLGTSCSVSAPITVNIAPAAITPPGSVTICIGGTATLADASPGGTWSSSNIALATVSGGGVVSAIAAGTPVISYTNVLGCSATKTVTVIPNPAPILPGPSSVCIGSSISLTDVTAGGVWSASNARATVTGGVVTGVSVGIDTIIYTVGTCFVTTYVTVNANPATITPAGPVSVCVGATTTLADITPGGTWSSGAPGTATVTGGGVVTGVAAGIATISYTNVLGCSATKDVTVNISPAAISPASANVCIGNTVTLTDAVVGGVWTSSSAGIASVAGGIVTGVSLGSATITYSIGTCTATATVTVSSAPAAGTITGPSSVCVGSTITLTDAAPGGVWSSGNPALATVSGAGVVLGVSGGLVTISYSVTNVCTTLSATATINVVPAGVGPILGPSMICAGTFATLTDTSAGGAWSSSNGTATISGLGLLTGISPGIDTISYTVVNACGTNTSTKIVTIGAFLTAGTILGGNTVCVASAITLTDLAPGGVWGSSNSHATVVGGVVTGVSTGVDTITYTVTSACGSATASHNVTVNPLPDAGAITGPSSVCIGTPVTYTETVSGGAWSLSNARATITGVGLLTPITAGVDTLSYSVTNSCGTASTNKIVTIGAGASAGTITGPSAVCEGSAITLGDATPGGVWSAVNANATVSVAGLVTGINAGVDTILYTVTNSCGTAIATYTITINPMPAAGVIVGASSVCAGAPSAYTDAASGGIWSMSNSLATISGTGILTPISAGIDTMYYTVTNLCGVAIASKVITIGAALSAGTISGPTGVCVGSAITLTDGMPGGTWSCSNGHATVSGGGIVTGISAGVDTVAYTVTGSCGTVVATYVVTISSSTVTGIITGAASVCFGSSIAVSDVVPGGTWSMTNTNATISPIGIVNGITPGLDTILYTVSGVCGIASATKAISIDGSPVSGTISGPSTICESASVTLTASAPGGVWSAVNPNVTIGSATGITTGVTAGTDVINYVVTNACGSAGASMSVTVNPLPLAGSITGPDSVCIGSGISLTDAAPGGIWSVGNTNAVVSIAGLVTGVAAGTVPVSYSVTNGCGTISAVSIITVLSLPSAGTISGISNVCIGSGITLTASMPGGIWTCSNTHAAIMGPGVIAGLSVGIDTISYTVTNSCGSNTAYKVVSVNPVPVVAPISGPSTQCTGTTISLADATPGGVWTSSSPGIATIGFSSGIVTGVSAGVATLTYMVTNSFGCPASVAILDTVSLMPVTPPITGPADVCIGSGVTLSNTLAGGLWSSGSPAIATVVAGTGVVSGVSSGTVTISYTVVNACGTSSITRLETVNPLPVVAAISGLASECVGNVTLLTDATPGGVWSSSNTAIATIGSLTGAVTGVSAGTVSIDYTVTNSHGCSSVMSIGNTVNAAPAVGVITGITQQCVGGSSVLYNATSGGVWSSSNPSVAVITGGGVVNGLTAGIVTISYTVSAGGCTGLATVSDTVSDIPVPSVITGSSSVCLGSDLLLSDASFGGIWSSGNTAIATVGSAGLVTGVSNGTDEIYYTISNSCGTITDSILITVQVTPSSGTITGPTGVCQGASVTLADAIPGGLWSATNSRVTIGSVTGLVSGISTGLDTIKYTVSNACGTSVATRPIAVNGLPYPGVISGYTSVCAGMSIALTESVTGGIWSSSNTAAATIAGGLVTGLTPGTTIISYSVTNACGTRSATHGVTVVPAGVCHNQVSNSGNLTEEIKLYPNPAATVLHIDAPVTVYATLVSIDGKVVIQHKSGPSIDVSDLANGMYFVSIYNEEGLLLKIAKFAKSE